MMKAGYRVYLYKDANAYLEGRYTIIHEPMLYGQKLSSGKIKQTLSEIHSFEFSIYLTHPNYNDIKPMKSLIRVVNIFDQEEEFFGRVLDQTGEMSSGGYYSNTFICENLLAYLHDSSQIYSKVENSSVQAFLQSIIDRHNSQVEPFKRFKIGIVTVTSSTDNPYRYTGYDSTFETIKKQLLDPLGGYLNFRNEPDGLYLDYLSKVGKNVNSPIRVGKNIKSAKRTVSLDGLITRIVPVGADLETDNRDEETGQYTTRERVTIASVNNGSYYIEDKELVKEFGIIQKTVDWTEIKKPSILKSRGEQYLKEQKIALSSWSVSIVERYLIDNRFVKTKLGNVHPIDNPPLSGIENLQIVEKTIDIINPQTIDITIGANSQSLTAFQLQQKEAQKSMEKALYDSNAARLRAEKQLIIAQEELKQAHSELQEQVSKIGSETSVVILTAQLEQFKKLKKAEEDNITIIQTEIDRVNDLKDNADHTAELSLLVVQLQTSQTRLANYEFVIAEIKSKIVVLGG